MCFVRSDDDDSVKNDDNDYDGADYYIMGGDYFIMGYDKKNDYDDNYHIMGGPL